MAPRPALQALAEQQQEIDRHKQALSKQANIINAQHERITQYAKVFSQQREQILALARGVRAIATAAGIEGHVRTAMQKRADEQNPAQPIPEPPAEAPVQTTQEVKTPEAFADVQAPGMVPGVTNDVAADTTSTVYTPGADIPASPVKTLVDVTAPVDGTQGPRPLNEVRTLTDVRVGDGMNPQTAFPLRGEFAAPPRMGAREAASNRTMAALRLARLQLQAGTAQADSDFVVAAEIEKDASMSIESILREIETLEKVSKAAANKQAQRPAGLVPKAASSTKSVPSLSSVSGLSGASATDSEVADADLFLD